MSQKENISLPDLPGTDRTWRQRGSIGVITAKQVPCAAVTLGSGGPGDRTCQGPVSPTAAAICLQPGLPHCGQAMLYAVFTQHRACPWGRGAPPFLSLPTVLTGTQHRCPGEGLCSHPPTPSFLHPKAQLKGRSNASNNKYKRQTRFSFFCKNYLITA